MLLPHSNVLKTSIGTCNHLSIDIDEGADHYHTARRYISDLSDSPSSFIASTLLHVFSRGIHCGNNGKTPQTDKGGIIDFPCQVDTRRERSFIHTSSAPFIFQRCYD